MLLVKVSSPPSLPCPNLYGAALNRCVSYSKVMSVILAPSAELIPNEVYIIIVVILKLTDCECSSTD